MPSRPGDGIPPQPPVFWKRLADWYFRRRFSVLFSTLLQTFVAAPVAAEYKLRGGPIELLGLWGYHSGNTNCERPCNHYCDHRSVVSGRPCGSPGCSDRDSATARLANCGRSPIVAKTPRITRISPINESLHLPQSMVIHAICGLFCFTHSQLLMSAHIEYNWPHSISNAAGETRGVVPG
jgi:hypothetical protein